MNGWPVQIGSPQGPWNEKFGEPPENGRARVAAGERDRLAQMHREYWERRQASGGKSAQVAMASAPANLIAQRPLLEPRSVDPQQLLIEPTSPGGEPREAESPANHGLRGLGDVVHAVTAAIGIKAIAEFMNGGKPCGGCEKRRQAMNRAVPFGKEQQ